MKCRSNSRWMFDQSGHGRVWLLCRDGVTPNLFGGVSSSDGNYRLNHSIVSSSDGHYRLSHPIVRSSDGHYRLNHSIVSSSDGHYRLNLSIVFIRFLIRTKGYNEWLVPVLCIEVRPDGSLWQGKPAQEALQHHSLTTRSHHHPANKQAVFHPGTQGPCDPESPQQGFQFITMAKATGRFSELSAHLRQSHHHHAERVQLR
jgi:hypothetical protein